MHLTGTHVTHRQHAWQVDFFDEAGRQLTVHLPESTAFTKEEAIDQAREMMVQLTPFGTRGGEPSLNAYDRLSNGNFDEDGVPAGAKH